MDQVKGAQKYPLLDHLVDPVPPFPEPRISNILEINEYLEGMPNRNNLNVFDQILYDHNV